MLFNIKKNIKKSSFFNFNSGKLNYEHLKRFSCEFNWTTTTTFSTQPATTSQLPTTVSPLTTTVGFWIRWPQNFWTIPFKKDCNHDGHRKNHDFDDRFAKMMSGESAVYFSSNYLPIMFFFTLLLLEN